MILHVVKDVRINKYVYTMMEDKTYCAEGNYTFGVLPRRLKVIDGMHDIFVLRQTQWIIKLITLLPILWFFHTESFPKYNLYQNGMIIGETKLSFFTPRREIIIRKQLYELYLHSNNFVSVMMDNIQIALIKKDTMSVHERNFYTIKYDEEAQISPELLLLFIAFIDVAFFNSHLKFACIKYEKTVGKDKFFHRTLWKPNK